MFWIDYLLQNRPLDEVCAPCACAVVSLDDDWTDITIVHCRLSNHSPFWI